MFLGELSTHGELITFWSTFWAGRESALLFFRFLEPQDLRLLAEIELALPEQTVKV